MNRIKSSKKTADCCGAPLYGLYFTFFLCFILLPFDNITYAQSDETQYQIGLRSRSFTPEAGIQTSLRDSLKAQLGRGEQRHVYIQLKNQLDNEKKAELNNQGLKLLAYIGSYTWYATVTDSRVLDFTSSEMAKQFPILGSIRWLGEIRPEDKIEPKIQQEGVGSYNRNPDGTVDIIVVFFSDGSSESINSVIERYGTAMGKPGVLNDVVVKAKESDIVKMAREDIVQWIEEVGAEDDIHNDGSRSRINVDPLQVAPYNLDGTNVQVGEWDGGEIDDTHDDLSGRVTIVEAVGVSDHATHVAGTLGGDGSRSAAEGGTANQWRGMATGVAFFSYSFLNDDLEPEEHDEAINTRGIDLSQNSWGRTGNFGDYRVRSAKYDSIVTGLYGRAIPIIFSAGNSGPGFTTVTPPGGTAKNVIAVGNVLSDNDQINSVSSRGPTDNDQTKPDIVAPGDQSPNGLNAPPDIRSTIPTDTYGEMAGTSMASPAVSGTIALMLQQYRITFFGDEARDEAPLPSTFKVILCHTAEDLTAHPGLGANLVGPDYVYGYGLIDANEAVDAILNNEFRQGSIQSAMEVDTFTVEVAAGEDELKVTIAWDDRAGTPGAADILQNDLDLMVINPAGNEFYSPWELDPNNPATPATRNTSPTEADADNHRDNVNVVEQVAVENPAAGIWTVIVKASDLPFPGQSYSIIANPLLRKAVDCTCACSASAASGNSEVAWMMIAPVAIGIVWRWRMKRKQRLQ